MNWFDIFKIQVGSHTTLVPKTLPKRRDRTPCNDRLQAYANKIENAPESLKDLYNSSKFDRLRPKFLKPDDYNGRGMARFKMEVTNYWHGGQRKVGERWDESQTITHRKSWIYNTVPENVACRALELLDQITENSSIEDEVDGWYMGCSMAKEVHKVGSNYPFRAWLTLVISNKEPSDEWEDKEEEGVILKMYQDQKIAFWLSKNTTQEEINLFTDFPDTDWRKL
tara:strand:+ start:766 stop:1440 length:675 start_codon:yes stop_codon:yes gene_type:complete